MSKGMKTGGRNFSKGKSGNPRGRPPIPKYIRDIREAYRFDIEKVIYQCLYSNCKDLDTLLKDTSQTALVQGVARMVKKAAETGDSKIIDFILKRTLGDGEIKAKDVGDKVSLGDIFSGKSPAYYPPANGLSSGLNNRVEDNELLKKQDGRNGG